MLIKVEGGTARNDENLCDSCQMATVATDSMGTKHIQCQVFNTMVHKRIVKSTAWKDTNHQSIWDMREQAYIVGRSSNAAGFRGQGNITITKYKKLTKEQQQEVDSDTPMDF